MIIPFQLINYEMKGETKYRRLRVVFRFVVDYLQLYRIAVILGAFL